MAKLVVLYKTPKNPAAFNDYYFSRHVPLAKTIPGLRRYKVSNGDVMTPQGRSDYQLVATLEFDSPAAIQAAFASEQGQKAGADLANFADGGAELLIFDTKVL